MKHISIVILLIFSFGFLKAQTADTFLLRYPVKKGDTIIFKRVIQFDNNSNLFHVKDYYENGQIQMDAFYSSFDKHIKEDYQCNYISNTKTGQYKEWYKTGQIKYSGIFKNGLRNGKSDGWYENGQKEAEESRSNGQLHGNVKYYSPYGILQFNLIFNHGLNQNPQKVNYRFLSYLPKDYNSDTLKGWPLIIYLHGGSDRGNNLKKLYSQGIPDQIYRGREFPFIIISPQCPEHIRWSTENWFESLFNETKTKYRIDTDRVYLTGMSLGGSGTWYLAAKYPDIFAAIAPMSGFTSHMDFIDDNLDKLTNIPVWAFHGKIDKVVPFEETERLIKRLKGKNKNLKFTIENEVGHWINWLVYPKQELYDWFLEHDKRSNNKN
jgi:pimeloyl-ACP methyl ester carboxylesterase